MNREQILNIASFIKYPLTNTIYYEYSGIDVYRLPLPDSTEMYYEWDRNDNHFTTEYHRKYSIPLLCRLLNIEYDENNFEIDNRIAEDKYDISILKPKQKYSYDVYWYRTNSRLRNIDFDGLTKCNSRNIDITPYHKLYRYPHECSRIINNTIDTNRKLFVSGDSQMIPDISFLSCFFKEIFYFDNRYRLNLYDKWKDIEFTDALVELNCLPLSEYTERNFM